MQRLSQKLLSLRDKELHCQKNTERWAKKNAQLRLEMVKAQAELACKCQQIQAESLVEEELDSGIRGLQAGEEPATHPSEIGPAWTQPSCNIFSRQELVHVPKRKPVT